MNVLPLARSTFSDDVKDDVDDNQLKVLSVAPFTVIPAPFAVTFVGVVTLAISIFLSATVSVVELRVVVVPFTVRSPPTITFPVVVIAAAPTVPVNVGLAESATEPVPVDVVTPVPPLATGRVPVTPLVSGSPVTLVIVPDAGVPNAGVVNVGLVNVLFVSV